MNVNITQGGLLYKNETLKQIVVYSRGWFSTRIRKSAKFEVCRNISLVHVYGNSDCVAHAGKHMGFLYIYYCVKQQGYVSLNTYMCYFYPNFWNKVFKKKKIFTKKLLNPSAISKDPEMTFSLLTKLFGISFIFFFCLEHH